MTWRRSYSRDEVEELLTAIERQAREAVALGERAQRDMGGDRFASYLDFRRKVEEVRALTALTEERLTAAVDEKIGDLRVEFERMDLLLSSLLVRATKEYFARIRDDQVLPIGAREMFEPELHIIEEMRQKLRRPQYEGRTPQGVLEDLDQTYRMIERIMQRAPALPDFSDAPSLPKPQRRLANLGRPVRT